MICRGAVIIRGGRLIAYVLPGNKEKNKSYLIEHVNKIMNGIKPARVDP